MDHQPLSPITAAGDREPHWLLNRPRWLWQTLIGLMVLLAVLWLGYQSFRYFADPGTLGSRKVWQGAIDIRSRFRETEAWFRGVPVYRSSQFRAAVYPPASYSLFGLAFNRLSWPLVKVGWYGLSLASLVVFSRQMLRHSLARTPWERLFIGLMPFSFYATGAALGNGQVVVFVLPLVLNSLLVLQASWLPRRKLWLGSGLMLAALVQPTIAAPFVWLLLFHPPRWRPGALVVSAYLALTAFAISFQWNANRAGQTGFINSLSAWGRRATNGARVGSTQGGYATLHNLMARFHLSRWNTVASLAVLLLLGGWIYRHRRGDLWLLLGVTALVARFWTYHRWYDDLLLVVPLICLFRVTRQPHHNVVLRRVAAVLFLWIWLFLLAPGILYTLPDPVPWIRVQVAGWIAALLLLVVLAEQDRSRASASTGILALPLNPLPPS